MPYNPPPAVYDGTEIQFSQGNTPIPEHCFGISLLWVIRHSRDEPLAVPQGSSPPAFGALGMQGIGHAMRFQEIEESYKGPKRDAMVDAALREHRISLDRASSRSMATNAVEMFNFLTSATGYSLFSLTGDNDDLEQEEWDAWNNNDWDAEPNKFIAHAVAGFYDQAAGVLAYFDPNYGQAEFDTREEQGQVKAMVWMQKYLASSGYAAAFNIPAQAYRLRVPVHLGAARPALPPPHPPRPVPFIGDDDL